ncbi:MAG: site-2 protease family protein [Bacteroidales bacterium]
MELNLAAIFIAFLVLLFSLSVHESAHAWAAWRLGDPTGRLLGRVSLNPLVHLDLVGSLLLPLLTMWTPVGAFGFAKPVPVDTRRLKDPRRDFMTIAAAGPLSNLALALSGALAYQVVVLVPAAIGAVNISGPLGRVAYEAISINIALFLINIIPIPPLDGGTVLAGLLPDRLAVAFANLRPFGFIILYALVLTGAFMKLVGPPYHLLLSWLL